MTEGEPGRPGLAGYPAHLLVAGRRCVVVGGGRLAVRKVEALLDAGAAVVVVALEASPPIRAWAESGRLTLQARAFHPSDLDGAWLATAACAW